MVVTLKSISMSQFKGIKEKTFEFDGKTSVVKGKNGSFKTTIATAYMWLFTDKDLDLNSNPDVKPIGVEECTPTVTVVMDVDGKQVEFSKVQKNKKSKPDENGNYKISTSNSYLVNSIPLTERDFKAKLVELGMPTDNDFLLMSHIDVFVGMKQADQRKILFGLIDGITDLDVAEKVDGIEDLKALMQNYSLDEIEAMQKASKKKSEEELKNIPGQIEGLELAKTEDQDTSEVELLIKSLNEDIATKQAEIDEIKAESNQYSNLLQEGLKLEFDRNSELQRMNEIAMSGRKEIENKLNDSANSLVDLKRRINTCKADISQTQQRIDKSNKDFENLKAEYEALKNAKFDDSNLICPCCGQTYPQDKQKEIKAKFTTDNAAKMHEINIRARDIATVNNQLKDDIRAITKVLDNKEAELRQTEKLVAELEKQLTDFKPTEVADTPELKAIDEKIAENKKAVEEIKAHNNDSRLAKANVEMADLQNKLADANKVIGANSNNVRIDAQIEKLSERRIELEQAKADCEKILYQLAEFSKAKNNLLTDEINIHFTKVKFQLFKIQKNGEYKEDCQILSLDDKPLGISTNTALQMDMQIDICQGFQRYNDSLIPLFIDNAEAFSTDTYHNIDCETQHIYLAVTDDELTVVKGE